MSLDANSENSEEAQGSVGMASPSVYDSLSSRRTPRLRLVRIDSADESVQPTPALGANQTSQRSSLHATSAEQSSPPLLGVAHTEASFGSMASLLMPSSRSVSASRTVNTSLHTQHQQLQGQNQEEAFLNALSSGKMPQTPNNVKLNELMRASREPRAAAAAAAGAAPAARHEPTLLHTTVPVNNNNSMRELQSTPPPQKGANLGNGLNSNRSSCPGSPQRPTSVLATTVIGFPATTTRSFGATTVKRASDTAAKAATTTATTTPPASAATSTAALFPTIQWIRTAFGKEGNGENRAQMGNESRSNVGAVSAASTASTPVATATGSPTSATAPPPPTPQHQDAAMRLHGQRMKAALRSQDEMRKFSVILRRLEEEGARALREERRRRQERYAGQRGNPGSSRSRRLSRNTCLRAPSTVVGVDEGAPSSRHLYGNSEGGQQISKDGDDNASESFSDCIGVEEEEEGAGVNAGGVVTATPPSLDVDPRAGECSGVSVGGGKAAYLGPSAKAAAEVEGAAKMSRVALFKLRDRTAREWVVLQRRRLEQRRAGPTALQRHMQASQLRLQATRTRNAGGASGADTEVKVRTQKSQQRLLESSKKRNKSSTNANNADNGGVNEAVPAFGPLGDDDSDDAGAGMAALHPVTGSSLAISWGEEEKGQQQSHNATASSEANAANEDRGADEADEKEHDMGADDGHSVTSVDATALQQHSPSPRSNPTAFPVSVDAQHKVHAVDASRALSSDLAHTTDSPFHAASSQSEELLAGTALAAALSVHSPNSLTQPDKNDTPLAARGTASSSALTDGVAGADTTGVAAVPVANPLVEDERLRRELQRLLFQADECTLYGLDACLNSKAKTTKLTVPPHHVREGPSRRAAPSAATTTATITTTTTAAAAGLTSRSASGSATRTPTGMPSLPPLTATPQPPSSSSLLPGRPSAVVHATTAKAKVKPSKQSATPLPVLRPSRQSTQILPEKNTATAAASAGTAAPRRFASLSSRKKHHCTPLPVERGVGEHAAALLQHEILLTRRYEMEAERGNAREIDRACETLQQLLPLREQLLEHDIQKGNAMDVASMRPPVPLLKEPTRPVDLTAPTTATTATTPPVGATSALTKTSSTTPCRYARNGSTDTTVDRSYHPQAILQHHRQLLYDEAVRMEARSHYAARVAYLDVLAQLAQRHVSTVSWPAVKALLTDAREQLRQEAQDSAATSPSTADTAANAAATGHAALPASPALTTTVDDDDGDDDDDHHPHHTPPDRASVTLSPRDKLQQLIVAHLGVVELSQWPVQEVLQRLAVLYHVPLYLLHECIAEQQRRFAHTYNYEERFRAVDRTVVGRGTTADGVLRLTLHRCRRPPLTPTRQNTRSSGNAVMTHSSPSDAANGTLGGRRRSNAAAAAAVAAAVVVAQVMGVPSLDPYGEAMYYIRLRVGGQSVSSSAVPLSSTATERGSGAVGGEGLSAPFSSARYSVSDGGSGNSHDAEKDGVKTGARPTGGHGSGSRGGGGFMPSTSASSAKSLNFLGQTLTVYFHLPDSAARKPRTTAGATGRPYRSPITQSIGNDNDANGDDSDDDYDERGCVVLVELMQSGVEAPLARGQVDLAHLGLSTSRGSGRVQEQHVQIPLKRKGYRTAELKATIEVSS